MVFDETLFKLHWLEEVTCFLRVRGLSVHPISKRNSTQTLMTYTTCAPSTRGIWSIRVQRQVLSTVRNHRPLPVHGGLYGNGEKVISKHWDLLGRRGNRERERTKSKTWGQRPKNDSENSLTCNVSFLSFLCLLYVCLYLSLGDKMKFIKKIITIQRQIINFGIHISKIYFCKQVVVEGRNNVAHK